MTMTDSFQYTMTDAEIWGRSAGRQLSCAWSWIEKSKRAEDPIQALFCLHQCFDALRRAEASDKRLSR